MYTEDKDDSTFVILNFPETMIGISRKLLAGDEPDYLTKTFVSRICSNLSYYLLLQRKYHLSLEAVDVSLKADSTYPLTFTNLPLAYIFNNQYIKAEKVYNELKDKPLTSEVNSEKFREAFLQDISDLESKGITHPDFAKVKELLKK